jgi:hypothetical protein
MAEWAASRGLGDWGGRTEDLEELLSSLFSGPLRLGELRSPSVPGRPAGGDKRWNGHDAASRWVGEVSADPLVRSAQM